MLDIQANWHGGCCIILDNETLDNRTNKHSAGNITQINLQTNTQYGRLENRRIWILLDITCCETPRECVINDTLNTGWAGVHVHVKVADCVCVCVCSYQALVGRQHNNNLCVVVPDHSPEVFCGVGQRMLGNDELITPIVTLWNKQTNNQNRLVGELRHIVLLQPVWKHILLMAIKSSAHHRTRKSCITNWVMQSRSPWLPRKPSTTTGPRSVHQYEL